MTPMRIIANIADLGCEILCERIHTHAPTPFLIQQRRGVNSGVVKFVPIPNELVNRSLSLFVVRRRTCRVYMIEQFDFMIFFHLLSALDRRRLLWKGGEDVLHF